MVWIATGNPIFNDAGSVTGYDGAWVCVNAGDDPGVKPQGDLEALHSRTRNGMAKRPQLRMKE